MPLVAGALESLSIYYGIKGVVDLAEGQESGYSCVSDSIECYALAARLRAHWHYNLNIRTYSLIGCISRVACLACTSQQHEHMAIRFLHRISNDFGSSHCEYFKGYSFGLFVLKLSEASSNSDFAIDDSLPNPFSDVLFSWNDTSSLRPALESVLEYHCQNMIDSGGDHDPEFKWSPFDLLPCELIYIRRLRLRLGLLTPSTGHDLERFMLDDHMLPKPDSSSLVSRVKSYYSRVLT